MKIINKIMYWSIILLTVYVGVVISEESNNFSLFFYWCALPVLITAIIMAYWKKAILFIVRNELIPSQGPTRDQARELTEFDKMMTFYYCNPSLNPGIFLAKIRQADNNGTLRYVGLNGAAVGFMAQFILQNKVKVVEAINISGFDAPFIKYAIAIAAKEDTTIIDLLMGKAHSLRKIMMFFIRPYIKRGVKYSPRTSPIYTPFDLDCLWGAFFATGDTLFVENILNFVLDNTLLNGFCKHTGIVSNGKEESTETKKATLGAAVWSLNSNATQHPLVKELIERRVKLVLGDLDGMEQEMRQEIETGIHQLFPLQEEAR